MRAIPALLLLAFATIALVPAALAQEPVTITIRGPTAIAPSSTHSYVITVTGGPAENNGTFHVDYSLEGDDLTGADPQITRQLANRQGKFDVNVTAPSAEGTIVLLVKAT